MQPLSVLKRKIYLISFVVIFIVFTPLVVLYAMGYRYGHVKPTGGVYVVINEPYAEVYVDRINTKQNGLLDRSVLIQNVSPGKHLVFVGKQGYRSWAKEIEVFSERVTEIHANIFPIQVDLIPIDNDDVFSDDEKKGIRLLFATSTLAIAEKDYRDTHLSYSTSTLAVSWVGTRNSRPFFFCNVHLCDNQFLISVPRIRSFDFYPSKDDTIVLSREDGVYVAELDSRSNQNQFPLIMAPKTDVAVYDREYVFIRKSDGSIYRANI